MYPPVASVCISVTPFIISSCYRIECLPSHTASPPCGDTSTHEQAHLGPLVPHRHDIDMRSATCDVLDALVAIGAGDLRDDGLESVQRNLRDDVVNKREAHRRGHAAGYEGIQRPGDGHLS